mgnify:CR=1 FL=1
MTKWKTNIIKTIIDILEITDSIDIKNNEETLFIFLWIYFHYMNFIFILYISYQQKILFILKKFEFPVSFIYNSKIRLLKELEGNCNLKNINEDSKSQYYCIVEICTANIKQIKINPEFNFISQENIALIGITPF